MSQHSRKPTKFFEGAVTFSVIKIKEGLRNKLFLFILNCNYLLIRFFLYMIRIMGNSTERVTLKDLNDVIYYKQVKEFTDAEYGSSRDLKREIQAGRIIQLEKTEAPRGSSETPVQQINGSNSSVSLSDIRALLREVLPASSSEDLKKAVIEAVREEISKIPVQQVIMGSSPVTLKNKESENFQDSVYVPEVSSKGLVSSIEVKKTETSGDSANNALAALRKLNSIPNK